MIIEYELVNVPFYNAWKLQLAKDVGHPPFHLTEKDIFLTCQLEGPTFVCMQKDLPTLGWPQNFDCRLKMGGDCRLKMGEFRQLGWCVPVQEVCTRHSPTRMLVSPTQWARCQCISLGCRPGKGSWLGTQENWTTNQLTVGLTKGVVGPVGYQASQHNKGLNGCGLASTSTEWTILAVCLSLSARRPWHGAHGVPPCHSCQPAPSPGTNAHASPGLWSCRVRVPSAP